MGKIQVLDEQMTNLIAAGEVIERCASVVKELVENAIDAGSTKINVSLVDSGLVEIRVSDNGCGMDNQDAKMALLPHATSKIKSKDDLFNIGTLGFRGEALASIIAVSNFKIITSDDGYHGTMLSVRGGVPISEAMISHPRGTEVIVKNLFFNTPARLQNLSGPNVELSYITDYVSKMAIAKSNIQFILSNNGKEILHTSGNGNLLEVIGEVYGNDIAREMLSIFDNNGIFKIDGYVSKIKVTRSTKQNIILLINGRLVHNSSIVNSVINGYGNLLMNGKYPIAIINITVDLGMVDVNVHPSKYEVRLSDEATLRSMISNAINSSLNSTDLSIDLDDGKVESKFDNSDMSYYDPFTDEEVKANSKQENLENQNNETVEEQTSEANNNDEEDNNQEQEEYKEIDEADYYGSLYEETEANNDDNNEILEEDDESEDEESSDENSNLIEENDNQESDDDIEFKYDDYEKENITVYNDNKDQEVVQEEEKDTPIYQKQEFSFIDGENTESVVLNQNSENRISKMYYIGQLFGTYILAQNEDDFYLIDQHAAMERINYEKIKAILSKNELATYDLLVPFTLHFSPSEAIIVNEKMDVINNLGIYMDDFGGNSFVVRTIPIWIFRGREQDFVEEIVTKVINDKGENKIDFLESLAKSLACKKSIKGNEYHSSLEIEYLLEELVKTTNPFTCPHGRPVIVKIKKNEVEKWFKRIVD